MTAAARDGRRPYRHVLAVLSLALLPLVCSAESGAQGGFERLLVTNHRALGPVALGGGYLVWETGGSQQTVPNELFQRHLDAGRATRLSPAATAAYGVASTSGWVVYAHEQGTSVELRAVSHDRSTRLTLARSLIAPIDSRADLVAWAEQDGSRQRVVVRNMATGKVWRAADLPRCVRGRCYRIDTVTLGRGGVAFDRGAVGPQPSFVVRRGFVAAAPDSVPIPGDPQPDLARSSSGAYYYAVGRGWFRWDLGMRRPRLEQLDATDSVVLDYESGRALLLSRRGCQTRLAVRGADGRMQPVAAPTWSPGVPRDLGPLCRSLTGYVWSGRLLIAAWAVQPDVSVQSHTDVGLVGEIVSSET